MNQKQNAIDILHEFQRLGIKSQAVNEMLEKIQPLIDLLDKYKIPYDIVYTDYVGKIIYEDDYQVGVIDE